MFEIKRNVFEKIEDWFLDHSAVKDKKLEKIYFKIYRFFSIFEDIYWYGPKNFLYNIWLYKSVLWSDKWFDSHYFLDLIKFKLKNDSKMYKKYGITVSADYYALQMELCAVLLDKIIKDEYIEPYITVHEKKWGTEIDFNKKISDIIRNRRSHLSDEEKKQESKEYFDIMTKADKEKNEDIVKVFNIIQQNVMNWWD
jgi:hypothetical protein